MENDHPFQNRPMPPESLPACEEAPLSPVSPRYPPYVLLKEGIRWGTITFVLALALVAGQLPEGVGAWAPAAAAGLGVLSGVTARLEAKRRAYALREHDLIYVRGLLVRRMVILPLSRVQHVESATGPLERRFNLVRLTCFTAGGLGADLVISGLERDCADRVRHFLLSRIRGRDEDNPAAADETNEGG